MVGAGFDGGAREADTVGFDVPAKAIAGFGFAGTAGSGCAAATLDVVSASGDGARGGLTFAGSGMLDGMTGRKWPSLSNRASWGRSLARKVGCMPPSVPVRTATVAMPLFASALKSRSSLSLFSFTADAISAGTLKVGHLSFGRKLMPGAGSALKT